MKNQFKNDLWTKRHFSKTVGGETKNAGAFIEIFLNKSGRRVVFWKGEGPFCKVSRDAGGDGVSGHTAERDWLGRVHQRWTDRVDPVHTVMMDRL